MNSLDSNQLVPYTTHNGIKIRKYTDAAIKTLNMLPYENGRLVLMFNIALMGDVKARVFNGKKFMDDIKKDLPSAYLFSLGYFGGHDFKLDLNR